MGLPLNGLPIPVASYTTSLAADIAADATSLTLTSATDDAGNAISGIVGLTIEGEFIVGSKSGTTVSSLLRGIDPQDGTTERTALKAKHLRGKAVVITDAPFLPVAYRLLNGDEGFPNILKYAGTVTPTDDKHLIPKAYADAIALAGAPDAATGTKGVTKLTTAPASPTEPIAVGATDVTATPTADRVPRANGSGKLAQAWLDLTASFTFTGVVDITANLWKLGGVAFTGTMALLNEATTFFNATDITGAEAETLTASITSNAASLHAHYIKATASDTLMVSADTERSTSSAAAYAKLKELCFRNITGGTIRVKYDAHDHGGGTSHFKLQLNGADIGTLQALTSDTYATISEDIAVGAGGSLSLWAYVNVSSAAYVRNFRIYYDRTPTTETTVVTD